MKPYMHVLGIETSCDETAVAICEEDRGLLAHLVHSQTAVHEAFGGVVPELASRDHIQKLLPLVQAVLAEAKLPLSSIDAIAYTAGPGLMGALLVGSTFAKTLGFALGIPTLAIHHMEGHLLAALLESKGPDYPFLSLLVSGGHTLLVEVKGLGQYQILGETLDDAVGEAFDKTAKLLGLGYPGGAKLSDLAKLGNLSRYQFPRPLTEKPGLDFSFSGLKTYALTTFQQSDKTEQTKADIAAAFETAVVDTLVIKCRRALKQTGLKQLVIAGGVGANQPLRQKLKALENTEHYHVFFPHSSFCTDNAAMIAYTGYLYLRQKLRQDEYRKKDEDLKIQVHPRWSMESLSS